MHLIFFICLLIRCYPYVDGRNADSYNKQEPKDIPELSDL